MKQGDHLAGWDRLAERCQALAGDADDGSDAALLATVRQLVDDAPGWGLPELLSRMVITGVLLRCIRRRAPELRDELTPVLLEFATGRTGAEAYRPDCLSLVEHCRAAVHKSGPLAVVEDSLRRVLQVIQTRYCEANLTLREVSNEVQLSISHVSRLLNQHAGCGFRALLNRLRIASAQRLLQDSALSIKQVAAAVGYRSTSELDRHFRQVLETTPTLFRQCSPRLGRASFSAASAPHWGVGLEW